jgi:hypothetical protein
VTSLKSLLEIAESAAPPELSPDAFGDVELPAKDGWRVAFFYDCGELDYISHFVSPDGAVVDFWEWPESAERTLLTCWRSVGDMRRLLPA